MTPAPAAFWLRFWGVRGSIACAGPGCSRYGGNTSCVEVRCGDRLLILDAGTGIRGLGRSVGPDPVDLDLLLTHTHIDHIVGMPFFAPFFDPHSRVVAWTGHLGPDSGGLVKVLHDFMAAPLFPVPPAVFECCVIYRDFCAGQTLEPRPGIRVRTAPLNHPNDATGYRIEFGGRSLCYVTDTVHVPGELDANVLQLIEGADVVIYDCTFTDEEFPRVAHFGHSTWQEGVRLCDAAGVKQLVIFHHDPSHDDDFMDRVAEEAELRRPGTVVAREGMRITL